MAQQPHRLSCFPSPPTTPNTGLLSCPPPPPPSPPQNTSNVNTNLFFPQQIWWQLWCTFADLLIINCSGHVNIHPLLIHKPTCSLTHLLNYHGTDNLFETQDADRRCWATHFLKVNAPVISYYLPANLLFFSWSFLFWSVMSMWLDLTPVAGMVIESIGMSCVERSHLIWAGVTTHVDHLAV